MIKPFIELKSTTDQYSYGDTSGVFIGSWCLIGVHHFISQSDEGWMFGVVICNIGFGVWRDTGE